MHGLEIHYEEVCQIMERSKRSWPAAAANVNRDFTFSANVDVGAVPCHDGARRDRRLHGTRTLRQVGSPSDPAHRDFFLRSKDTHSDPSLLCFMQRRWQVDA